MCIAEPRQIQLTHDTEAKVALFQPYESPGSKGTQLESPYLKGESDQNSFDDIV